ncbi:hypothetical protein ACMFMG_002799 [Clarireedia jacksonii]
MGWFDGISDTGRSSRHSSSGHHKKHHTSSSSHHHSGGSPKSTHSRDRSRSRTRSIFGDSKHSSSKSSFFGFNSRPTSHYKRSPRSGFLKRMYAKLQKLLADLIYYMKRHPVKVFVLVIMPLVTGGALAGLLKRFGIRLPAGLDKLMGGRGGKRGGLGGGRDSYQYERSRVEGSGIGGMGKLGMLAGGMDGVSGAMKLAKMFM